MIPKPFAAVLLLAVSAALPAAGSAREVPGAASCLTLEQGWVRATVAGRAMTAAYGQLRNRCDRPVALDHLLSPQAHRVELHRTEVVDGMSRMRRVDNPQVPAGGSLSLAPGGLHLMLHGLQAGLVDGATLDLVLGARADDALQLRLPVLRQAPAAR